jgi:peptide/nickel transport system permease protein
VGLPLTQPSLGMLIANGYEYIFSQQYWVSLYPGIALLVMIVTMNLLGDRLRDLNNPRLAR